MILLLLQACFLLNDLGLAPADSALLAADPVCSKYLTCVAAVEPGELSALVDTYGESGSCWGSEATAEVCASACDVELDALREQNPDEPECGGAVPFDGSLDWDGHWDISVTGPVEDACESPDEDFQELQSVTLEEFGMNFSREEGDGTYFRAFLMTLEMDCGLDGDAFSCGGFGAYGTSGPVAMVGRFNGQTHATADYTVTQDGRCLAGLALALTASE